MSTVIQKLEETDGSFHVRLVEAGERGSRHPSEDVIEASTPRGLAIMQVFRLGRGENLGVRCEQMKDMSVQLSEGDHRVTVPVRPSSFDSCYPASIGLDEVLVYRGESAFDNIDLLLKYTFNF